MSLRPNAAWAGLCATAVLVTAGAVTVATADGEPAEQRPAAADSGFARDMSVHHQQAVEMSFIVRDRTKDEEIRRLAYDIANTQANQRGMMLGWLDMWGEPKSTPDKPMTWMGMPADGVGDGSLMPGMATRTDLEKLRRANGRAAEVLYLQLMTAHHKGGVHMAQACEQKCTVGVEKNLAGTMVAGQNSEIDLMANLLEERGATAER